MKVKKYRIVHPLFGTSFTNWIQLLLDNDGVDFGFFLKAMFVTVCTICIFPARLLFKTMYGQRISKTEINNPPIFIIGHWRSGTTFLHELMSQDPKLAHVSLWHTLIPDSFLMFDGFKKFFSLFLPTTRPMDEIKVDINAAYEEEAGMATLGRWSFFHCFMFPRDAKRQFCHSVLFKDLSDRDMELWKKNYLGLLKAVTFESGGQRLILKNPSNTARVKTLLELFPKARFIHIYRNPYKVYYSTIRTRINILYLFALQKTTHEEVEQHVINDYVSLMKSYL